MGSERDVERREIEELRRLATGTPSEEAWAEITAAMLRFIEREKPEDGPLARIDFVDATMGHLSELRDIAPGAEREERARELLAAIERMASDEYERVDRMRERAEWLGRDWEEVFGKLEGWLSGWPDELRVLGADHEKAINLEPAHPCWSIFRRVELKTSRRLGVIHDAHPHLTFTLGTTELIDSSLAAIPSIRTLDLSGRRAEELTRLTRLTQHAAWSELRSIRLYNIELDVSNVRRMSAAGMFEGLESLSLRHCRFAPEFVAELVEHLDPSRIAHIDLTHSPLGAAGLRQLVSLSAARPAYLDLTGCALDASSVARLARARFARDVTHLGLSENDVEDAGVTAIANSSTFVGLRRLELRAAKINDAGAHALADSVHLLDLRELDVRDNRLTQPGLVTLATSPHLDRLDRLDVIGNHLDQRTWLRLTGDEVAHAPLRAHLASQIGR